MPPSLTRKATAKPDPSTGCLNKGCVGPSYDPGSVELTPYVDDPYIACTSVESKGYAAGREEFLPS